MLPLTGLAARRSATQQHQGILERAGQRRDLTRTTLRSRPMT